MPDEIAVAMLRSSGSIQKITISSAARAMRNAMPVAAADAAVEDQPRLRSPLTSGPKDEATTTDSSTETVTVPSSTAM